MKIFIDECAVLGVDESSLLFLDNSDNFRVSRLFYVNLRRSQRILPSLPADRAVFLGSLALRTRIQCY